MWPYVIVSGSLLFALILLVIFKGGDVDDD